MMGDMHPEIEWQQAQGLPHGGTYHGLDEVRRNIFDPLDVEWWDEFTAVPDEFLDAGDEVVVLGRYRGVAKETGKTPRRAVRARLDDPGGAGGPFSPVPRHGGLGRGAQDLIIDTVGASRIADTPGLRPSPRQTDVVPPIKEDT